MANVTGQIDFSNFSWQPVTEKHNTEFKSPLMYPLKRKVWSVDSVNKFIKLAPEYIGCEFKLLKANYFTINNVVYSIN